MEQLLRPTEETERLLAVGRLAAPLFCAAAIASVAAFLPPEELPPVPNRAKAWTGVGAVLRM